MFNRQKENYTIYRPNKSVDDYKQERIDWEEIGTEPVFIALNSHAVPAVNNSLFAQQCEWIGVTSPSSQIQMGYRVGKYEVIFVVDAGREKFLYLKDYGRNS